MFAIQVSNISKSFGKTKALQDVSFVVEENKIFGFIGPDGSGKTTLFRILTTLLLADSGTATLKGLDVVRDYKEIRKKLGYMPGRFSLYQDLTVEENIKFFASIFGTTLEENYELVKEIYSQIEPFKKRKAGKLSGGMKQKLALSCALIHKPEVLILDEPTTGVDAVSRVEFWDMLMNLKKQGITILVSTPYMDEAKLCDNIALIQGGKILDVNTPANIVNTFKRRIFGIKSPNKNSVIKCLGKFASAYAVYPFGEYIHYLDNSEKQTSENIEAYLSSCGNQDFQVKIVEADIEDVFIELMKKQNER